MTVHPTAIIAPGAIISADAEIGPYAVIGGQVSVGSGSKIGAHVVIDGITSIGKNCQIFSGASLGQAPQSIHYKGEPSELKIGDNVVIREYVTVHRGSAGGCTTIGNDCFIMNYAHIAHDCTLGRGVIMANSATLAGHITVGDGTVMAGVCVFHQYVRIGRLCMVSGMTGSRMDLPPFVTLDGLPPAVRGLNLIGMKRNGFAPAVRTAIKRAYKLLYHSGLNYSQAIERIKEEHVFPEVQEIIDFFSSSKRGIISAHPEDESASDEIKETNAPPVRNTIEIKV